MKKYLEKKSRKYVIADLSIPTMYLHKTPGKQEYCFVGNIEMATKTLKKSVAKQILKYYQCDTGLSEELVVIPIDISYEIVEE